MLDSKKCMVGIKKNDLIFVLIAFLIWRLGLIIIQYFAFKYVLIQNNFLGGGVERYLKNPYFWSYLNFDGEHYLSIALNGYRHLQYFFFPLFPMIVSFISKIFGSTTITHAIIGQTLSNIMLVVSLVGIFKLIPENKNIAKKIIILLLFFPTSFYLVSYYTESLFLAICIWSFYFAKRKKWFLAFFLAGLSTATRIVGLALVGGLIVDFVVKESTLKKFKPANLFKVLVLSIIGISGMLIYVFYLEKRTGDPLNFFNNVGIYGQQRSAAIILLPRVFYRYIFKILPSVDYSYFPIVFTTWLEFVCAIIISLILAVSILANLGIESFKIFKLNWGYLTYSILAYLIPTFSGSFSSMPRYLLVIFPVFILFSKANLKFCLKENIILYTILMVILVVSFSLFVRGYWVS